MKAIGTILLLLLALSAVAQTRREKRANSFNTYEVTGLAHHITRAHFIHPGIAYGFGRVKLYRPTFHWFEFELLMKSNFRINSYDLQTGAPERVYGRTGGGFVFRYNWAYWLRPGGPSRGGIQPFATASANASVVGDYYNYHTDPVGGYPAHVPGGETVGLGLGLGGGAIFPLANWLGLRLAGGYSFQVNTGYENYKSADDYGRVYLFGSHPYFSASLRFTHRRH